jgi:outer membrane protein OmpA-like peptidoglycan-associated protein
MRSCTFRLALATLALAQPPQQVALAEPRSIEGEHVASPQLLAIDGESAHSAAPRTAGSDENALSTGDDLASGGAAATAFAAPLQASEDTCMRSRALGVQAVSFGFSIATTSEDVNCRRRHNARALEALGYPDAALQLLCMDREVRQAMRRSRTPCLQRVRLAAPAHPPAEPAAEPPPLATYSVLFDFDKYNLRPGAGEILTPLLARLQADPTMKVDIEGHTDWVGSDAYNLRLSQRRAQAVVNWLVAHGISRDRMRAIGKGEREPIAANETAAGRQLNRRTEVRRWE